MRPTAVLVKYGRLIGWVCLAAALVLAGWLVRPCAPVIVRWLATWWTWVAAAVLTGAGLIVLEVRRTVSGGRNPAHRAAVSPPLSSRTIVIWSVLVAAVGVAAAVVLLTVYGGGEPRDQLDAIRTAGTIVVGTGGGAALLLAARRQRSTELTLAHTEVDAAARRITELYTKAVEQLGSDKAPVRLGGLYALERLAQDNPDQRPTIVSVICAYLRMPYRPPSATVRRLGIRRPLQPRRTSSQPTGKPVTTSADSPSTAREELEVRLAAQRILARHLHPGDPDKRAATFWVDIDLDLTGATLIDFNLSGCIIRTATFTNTHFHGYARFDETKFYSYTWFNGAEFHSYARFGKAEFRSDAGFGEAEFHGDAWFGKAVFHDSARFGEAQFHSDARFDEAQFHGYAGFDGAGFGRGVPSEVARFTSQDDAGDEQPPPPISK